MGVAARYNKGGQWDVQIPEGVEYVKLEAMQGTTFTVNGIYFSSKGKYGRSVSVLADGKVMVNLPSHMLRTCEDMVADPEVIEAVNGGKLGMAPYEYLMDAYPGMTFWSGRWVDIDGPA